MSFLGNVPSYITQLEREVRQLEVDRRAIDWGHECDCEFCTRNGEGSDDAEVQADAIDKQIKEHQRMIKRLRRYADMFIRSN